MKSRTLFRPLALAGLLGLSAGALADWPGQDPAEKAVRDRNGSGVRDSSWSSDGVWVVKAFASPDEREAEDARRRLMRAGYLPVIVIAGEGEEGESIYWVYVGELPNKERTQPLEADLKRNGYPEAMPAYVEKTWSLEPKPPLSEEEIKERAREEAEIEALLLKCDKDVFRRPFSPEIISANPSLRAHLEIWESIHLEVRKKAMAQRRAQSERSVERSHRRLNEQIERGRRRGWAGLASAGSLALAGLGIAFWRRRKRSGGGDASA